MVQILIEWDPDKSSRHGDHFADLGGRGGGRSTYVDKRAIGRVYLETLDRECLPGSKLVLAKTN